MTERCRCERMAYRGHVRGCGTNRIGALIYTDPEIYSPCCLGCILAGYEGLILTILNHEIEW